MPREGAARTLLAMSAGLIVWAAHFAALYAVNAVACARGFADARIAGLEAPAFGAALATVAALAALGAVTVAGARAGGPDAPPRTRAFRRWTTVAVAGLALLGVLWGALPALLTPPCL
jgi:hypothetical protein